MVIDTFIGREYTVDKLTNKKNLDYVSSDGQALQAEGQEVGQCAQRLDTIASNAIRRSHHKRAYFRALETCQGFDYA